VAVNYSLGAPEPTVGETIWMRCPYQDQLCGADATFTVAGVTDDFVTGLMVCALGHRWRITRLADEVTP
jgi:hypothetical protein